MNIETKLAPLSEAFIPDAVEKAVAINASCLDDYTTDFKYSHSENGFYPRSGNTEWTTGFWTGQLWLCYSLTGDERFRNAALVQVDSFLERIEKKIDVEHHDMGFLYSPSCVAAYKHTGSETGRKAALLAADNLISRFHEKGQFIQAWGSLENRKELVEILLRSSDHHGKCSIDSLRLSTGYRCIKHLAALLSKLFSDLLALNRID